MRHAYARFDWPATYLTAGQTTLIFNSVVSSQSELEGVSSNHGDMTAGSRNRAPQFILGQVIPIAGAKLELAGLRAQIKAAERDGNMQEAMRLADQITKLAPEAQRKYEDSRRNVSSPPDGNR